MDEELETQTIVNIFNLTLLDEHVEELTSDDAAWALTCSFLILTMQTGFAMLECGIVSIKNVGNIMIKNVIDVSVGGFSYWLLGHGLSFGAPSNFFCGYGDFLYAWKPSKKTSGSSYASYFFHLSFASTATTIVSGAVAERMKLHSYVVFSFMNTFIYCIPASWAWNSADTIAHKQTNSTPGFLYSMRFFDFAGVCVVHLTGGTSALVAAYMLGPRLHRFDDTDEYQMNSPVTSLTGMFMLWWAWLGFNCGSTFGVSGRLWTISALVSVTTLNGSIGGGITGLIMTMSLNKGCVHIDDVINSCLGGLVAITGVAAVTTPLEALFIGAVGALIAVGASYLLTWLRIDDPVGAVPVHFFAASWGTIAVGLFAQNNREDMLRGLSGLIHGGSFHLLGIQVLAMVCIILWSGVTTFIILIAMKYTMGIRMSEEEEILGADYVEHNIRTGRLQEHVDKVLRDFNDFSVEDVQKMLHLMKTENESAHADSSHRIYSTKSRGSLVANKLEKTEVGKVIGYATKRAAIRRMRQLNGRIMPVKNEIATLAEHNGPDANDSRRSSSFSYMTHPLDGNSIMSDHSAREEPSFRDVRSRTPTPLPARRPSSILKETCVGNLNAERRPTVSFLSQADADTGFMDASEDKFTHNYEAGFRKEILEPIRESGHSGENQRANEKHSVDDRSSNSTTLLGEHNGHH